MSPKAGEALYLNNAPGLLIACHDNHDKHDNYDNYDNHDNHDNHDNNA